jgi:Mn-dependent DtxR family transcriptional regulator
MSNWTFITNHGAVLSVIANQGKVKASDIASELNITERTVRRIIADLASDGYITKKREDKINRYQINTKLTLRRQEMKFIKLRDLIRVFCQDKENAF